MKPRHECPICHVEVKKGMRCNYHAQDRRRHQREARKYWVARWIEMLNECVDDARSGV